MRIQRKRTKGWRMPEGTIYVGRPTRWGNPYQVGDRATVHGHDSDDLIEEIEIPVTAAMAVEAFRVHWEMRLTVFVAGDAEDIAYVAARRAELEELRGKDLACWCPLDQPCHTDVLLELANS